jgi:hypothetical protein
LNLFDLNESGPIAQLVEQMAFNHWVAGSSPARITIIYKEKANRLRFAFCFSNNFTNNLKFKTVIFARAASFSEPASLRLVRKLISERGKQKRFNRCLFGNKKQLNHFLILGFRLEICQIHLGDRLLYGAT